jgi:PAS domain S-box-containing protein
MGIAELRAIALFIAAFLNSIFTLLIWFKGKSKEAYYLGWMAFFSALYGFTWWAMFFFDNNKLFWSRTTWSAVFIVSANIIFIYYLTGRVKFFKLKIIIWYGLATAIMIIALATPYIIPVVSSQYPFIIQESAGPLNQIARIFPVVALLLGIYYLFVFHNESQGHKKLQLKYFISGLTIYVVGGLIFGGILPFFFPDKFFSYLDAPVYFSVVWLSMATYAMIKKELFEIKIILTELLASLIGLILFVQIFLMANWQAKIIELIIFAAYCFIGYLLIKATYWEIKKEEEAERLAGQLSDLNENLENKVEKKTKQLRDSINKIEEERNKTMAIIANFTDPIIVLDSNNKISMINPAAYRVFSLKESDLGKKIITDGRFGMADFKPIIKKDFKINQIGENNGKQAFAQEEIIFEEKGQELVYKVITAKVLDADKETLGTMKIFYDLTREKMIDRLKSEFISVAAHQLRTPLSAIKWIIGMILHGDAGQLNLEQQELLGKGYISNERIIRLVNDLLHVSHIEEGKFGFDFKKTDFQEVLDVALANVEALAVKNHQQLVVNKSENLPKIYLDKDRLVMVMQNLLSNAINYSPPNSKVEINIQADKANLEVKVIDHGVGIPEKDQPKLFSKFFRAANVVKMETEGSGLGLFIVKNIIIKHNGQISLKSQEGKGTEITFSLPIKKPANL